MHSEGDEPWDFFGGNNAEAETPVLWLHDGKNGLMGNTLMLGSFEGRKRYQ